MQLKHRHIEIFHTVMTTGNVTRSASLLQTSQPTVSRELRQMERILEFKLFERKGRSIIATEQAVLLHSEVQRSFSGLLHIVQVAQAIRDGQTAHIKVGCMPMFSRTIMPNVCRRFIHEQKSARISFSAYDQTVLLKELVELKYEIGLLETLVAVDGLSVQEFALGDELCILPKGHHLCERDIIEPSDLNNECFIGVISDDVYRRRYDEVLEEAGISKSAVIETNTIEAVCSLVSAGTGVAIVNPVNAYSYRNQSIEVRKLTVSIPFIIGIFRPLGRPLTHLGSTVSKILADECQKLRSTLDSKWYNI